MRWNMYLITNYTSKDGIVIMWSYFMVLGCTLQSFVQWKKTTGFTNTSLLFVFDLDLDLVLLFVMLICLLYEHYLYTRLYGLKAGLAGKYQWREFPVVITWKNRPGKYPKFELKQEVWFLDVINSSKLLEKKDNILTHSVEITYQFNKYGYTA